MFLDSLTNLVKAVTDLIATAWPKHADTPLRHQHLIQEKTGTLDHMDWIVVEPHCFYCGRLKRVMSPGEMCPYFR